MIILQKIFPAITQKCLVSQNDINNFLSIFIQKQDEDRMAHYTKRITVVREKIWRLRVREAMVLVDTEQFVLLGQILEDFR